MKAGIRAEEPDGGWPDGFGVVTACNPKGVTLPDSENAALTQKLESSLRGAGKLIFPVTGCDRNSAHEEPGFGVVCDEGEILRLGREWEQLAVFWVEDGEAWLLFCEPGGEKIHLRSLPEMLRT